MIKKYSNFTIKFTPGPKPIVDITYKGKKTLYVEFINTDISFIPISWTLIPNSSKSFKFNNFIGKKDAGTFDSLLIVDNEIKEISYFKFNDSGFIKSTPIDFSRDFPFIFLTGHEGGGTSIVAKSFRYLGVHIGDDAGNFENRKIHESHIFRAWAIRILPHLYPSLKGFDLVCSVFNIKPCINMFKCPSLEKHNANLLLSRSFPNSKFISVIKGKSKNTHSREGKQFNNTHEYEIYKEQYPTVEGNPLFHLDFNTYFTDFNYVNKVLKFIGSSKILTQDSFNDMLKAIKFDNSRLTK